MQLIMVLVAANINIKNKQMILTPCHKKYYRFPNNEFLKWNDWNCLYDFIYDQHNIYGRTQLFTPISALRAYIKREVKNKTIKFFSRKTTRDRYIKRKTIQ